MQCVFLWQDNEFNSSDTVRVQCFEYFGRTAISIVAVKCVFLWQDNDINCNDAMPVLCILAGQ